MSREAEFRSWEYVKAHAAAVEANNPEAARRAQQRATRAIAPRQVDTSRHEQEQER